MTNYNFTVTLKTEANETLTEDEMSDIVNHLLELTQWAEVGGIVYA